MTPTDLTDPAPATSFAHLDATTVLSRQIAEIGIYPAVDPLDSTSRILDPRIVGDEHYINNIKECDDIVNVRNNSDIVNNIIYKLKGIEIINNLYNDQELYFIVKSSDGSYLWCACYRSSRQYRK